MWTTTVPPNLARRAAAALLGVVLLGTSLLPAAGAVEAASAITDQRIIEVPDGEVLAISPDGAWLAVMDWGDDEQELCAWDAATLDEATCVAWDGPSVAPDSVSWSPDSTRFVFTEDGLGRLDEGDVWVFDREAGTVTDLTDDGASGGPFNVPADAPADFAPAWSPDGTAIAFARTAPTGETVEEDGEDDPVYATTLMRVDAAGGEAEAIVTVAEERLSAWGIRWLADDTLVYTVAVHGEGGATNGIWRVPSAGGEPEQLAAQFDDGISLESSVVEVAPDVALVQNAQTDTYWLLDLATGDLSPVADPDDPEAPDVVAASLSPDGTRLVTVIVDEEGHSLVVRDLESGDETPAGALDDLAVTPDGYQSAIDWASETTVLVHGPGRVAIVVSLAAD